MNAFQYSPRGLALTESFEGFRLEGYRDQAGTPTIGYGHTGPEVRVGAVITQAQAEILLHADIAQAVAAVNRAVTVPIQQHEFDALVDFTFNLGVGSLLKSSLLSSLNAGAERAKVAAYFAAWCMAAGQRNEGLARRRAAEAALFLDSGPA